MQIIKQAAEKANSLDPHKIAESCIPARRSTPCSATISYDTKGDRTTSDYVWYVWKKQADGKIAFEQIL